MSDSELVREFVELLQDGDASWMEIGEVGHNNRDAILARLSQPTDQQLVEELRLAREAFRDYACHAGDRLPCLRPKEQCYSECGKVAGDAFQRITSLLATIDAGRAMS